MKDLELNAGISRNHCRHLRMVSASVCFLLFIQACELYTQDDYREYVVLEALAVANRPLPEVRLSRTLPTQQEYQFSEAALDGANIQIVLLDGNGDEEELFGYMPSSEKGIYVPENSAHLVLPKRTYRIDIDFSNRQEQLYAQTFIPEAIEITGDIPARVVYQSSDQLEMVLSASKGTESQKIFIFEAIALNPALENLAPFWRELIEDEEADIEDFFVHSTQLVNEGNFNPRPDGTLTLKYPWIGIAFFEDNLIVANSVDKNMADLISSQDVQLGGSSLSPGEIPNLHYNVEGGIGIFGGMASDTIRTFVERPGGM